DAGPASVVDPVGDLGLLRVEVPPDASWVDVSFGDTPIRKAALAVSLVGVLGILGLAAPGRPPRLSIALVGVAAVAVLGIGLVVRADATSPMRGPIGSFANGARLLDVREDEPGVIQLLWTTDRPITDDLHVAVRLLDSAGAVVAQRDSRPRRGLRPTTTFRPGYVVRDLVDLRLLPDLSD